MKVGAPTPALERASGRGQVLILYLNRSCSIVWQVILYLTSTHQKNPLPVGRDPGNPGDYFWHIPRAIARSDPLEDEDSGRREWLLSGFYDCLSRCPFLLSLYQCLPKTMSFVNFCSYFPMLLTYVGVFLEKKKKTCFVVFPFLMLLILTALSLLSVSSGSSFL